MSKFFNQLNNIKAGRAKVKAYGEGGTVDALESARDYLREKYNDPEAGIPTKVATVLGLVPVNLARSAARAVTAPARSMTDENFNPEEEAANMAGFVTTGGIGLSKAGLGPKGDVLGMGVGKKLEPFGKEFNQLITEGTDQEYSGVAKLIEDWNYNGNKNAISKLEKHPEYASYKQTIDQILSAAYPDGKIPVYRKKGLHGTGKEGKFVSTSILPEYGSKKSGNDFFINTKDVHAIGNLEEGEFIVKPVALQPTSEPPTPGAVHQRALGAKLFGLK